MEITTPKSLAEIKRLCKPIPNVNVIHGQKLSRMDKLAIWITEHIGTMGFFFIIFLWTLTWLGWNTLAPKGLRYDPFPAFALWLFISNMIQIFLMPLIMIGQNLQSAHAEIRAEADFEVNTKAEIEIETILLHLENQNKLILQILEQIQKNDVKKS
jgi:uncharacterized membrane protein